MKTCGIRANPRPLPSGCRPRKFFPRHRSNWDMRFLARQRHQELEGSLSQFNPTLIICWRGFSYITRSPWTQKWASATNFGLGYEVLQGPQQGMIFWRIHELIASTAYWKRHEGQVTFKSKPISFIVNFLAWVDNVEHLLKERWRPIDS